MIVCPQLRLFSLSTHGPLSDQFGLKIYCDAGINKSQIILSFALLYHLSDLKYVCMSLFLPFLGFDVLIWIGHVNWQSSKKINIDFNIFILLFNNIHTTNFQLISPAIQCWDLFEKKRSKVLLHKIRKTPEAASCVSATYCLNVKHFPSFNY